MPTISLRAARVNAELSQAEVSKVMNVDRQTILNWEKGKTRIGTSQLAMLCQIYKMPSDFIYLPK